MKKQYLPKVFLLFLYTFSLSVNAQDVSSGTRSGYYFSVDGQWNTQTNLNRVLQNNNLPQSRSFLAGFGAGWLFRFGQFEASADALFGGRQGSRNNVQQEQMYAQLSLGGKYLFGSSGVKWYPMAGVGFATTSNRFTQENSTTDINAVLTTNRNTSSLYNRQGVATLGVGLRFTDSTRSFAGLEAGYRLGFATTPWSTRMNRSSLTNSVTDELRQFYVRLIFGFYKGKRSRSR
jgi:hypothetical protein